MQQSNVYRTGVYGRTSKDDPRKVTIDIQKKTLREWASADLETSLEEEYWDDGVSGIIPIWERPSGRRLFNDIQSGRIQAVAVAYADRFGRTLREGLNAVKDLEDLGAKLICVNEGWDARRQDSPIYMQFRFMMAEEEHRRIKQRMEGGKLRAIERDNAPPGGPLTFGYTIDEHGKFLLHPTEAPIVIRVFSMFLSGDNLATIFRWLLTTGVRPGQKFQKRMQGSLPYVCSRYENAKMFRSRVGKILRCRTYLGERLWKGRKFPCPPLIDQTSFDRVQLLLAGHGNKKSTCDPNKGFLSGLFKCSMCDSIYRRHQRTTHTPGGTIKVQQTYRCDNLAKPKKDGSFCTAKTIDAKTLEGIVWDKIESYLRNPEAMVREAIAADAGRTASGDEIRQRITAMLRQAGDIEIQVKTLWEEQAANSLPLGWVMPQIKRLNTERESLEAQLDAARQELAAVDFTQADSAHILAEVAHLRAGLEAGLSPTAKRAFIESIWAGGVIHTFGIGHQKTAEAHFELKWGEISSTHVPTESRAQVSGSTGVHLLIPFNVQLGRIA